MKKKQWENFLNRGISWSLVFSIAVSFCFAGSLVWAADDKTPFEMSHRHTFACYEEYELDCRGDHPDGEHLEACYTYSGERVCGLEEGESHTHNDGIECEAVAKVLSCGKTEADPIIRDEDEELIEDDRLEEIKGREDEESTWSEKELNEKKKDPGEGQTEDSDFRLQEGNDSSSGQKGELEGTIGEEEKETDISNTEEDGAIESSTGQEAEDTKTDIAEDTQKDSDDFGSFTAFFDKKIGWDSTLNQEAEEEFLSESIQFDNGISYDGKEEKLLSSLYETENITDIEDAKSGEEGEDIKETDPAENTEDKKDIDRLAGSGNVKDTGNAEESEDIKDAGDAGESEDIKDTGNAEKGEDIKDTGNTEESEDIKDIGSTEDRDGIKGIESTKETGSGEGSESIKETESEDIEEDRPLVTATESNLSYAGTNGHVHTEGCYITIYKCRKIQTFALSVDQSVRNETELRAAITDAAGKGPTEIIVEESFEVSADLTITSGTEIVLYLNGNTILYTGSDALFKIDGGVLTLRDREPKDNQDPQVEETYVGGVEEVVYENGSLTYYVTESTVNENGLGTEERVKKCTVTSMDRSTVKADTGALICQNGKSDSLISVTNGGTLLIKDGRITNQCPGNPDPATKGEAVRGILVNGGNLTMTGGCITECGIKGLSLGGGILALGESHLDIQGGMIEENFGCAGGGIYVRGGTLEISGGSISDNHLAPRPDTANPDYNGSGGGVSVKDGTFEISGGIISTNDAMGFGGGLYVFGNGSSARIGDHALIVGNFTNESGGGVCIGEGTTAEVSGNAVIGGNTARAFTALGTGYQEVGHHFGGGGIFARESASLEIGEECYITNNYTSEWKDEHIGGGGTGGGGIFSLGTLNIHGGYVTGNKAEAGGGGVYARRCSFQMTDGIIAGNTSVHDEGGGLRTDMDQQHSASVSARSGKKIYITNNKTETTKAWGGGGVFNVTGGKLEIKNVLVTDNTAKGFGGGIGGCYHGENYIFNLDGGAIYKNKALGESPKIIGNIADKNKENSPNNTDSIDAYTVIVSEEESTNFKDYPYGKTAGYQDFYSSNHSVVDDTMMGHGSAGWIGSGGDKPEAGDPVGAPIAIPEGGQGEKTSFMGLTAHPSPASIARAEAAAKVIITGNYSEAHGGGITNNGTLIIGEDSELPQRGKIIIRKTVAGASDNNADKSVFQFLITLTNQANSSLDNYYDAVYQTTEGRKEDILRLENGRGEINLCHGESVTISGIPLGTVCMIEEQEIDGYSPETGIFEEIISDQNKIAEFSFVNIKKLAGDLTLSKTVKGPDGVEIGDDKTKFKFTVTLFDEIGNPLSGRYQIRGKDETIASGETVELSHGESITIVDLPEGTKYMVVENMTDEQRLQYHSDTDRESGSISSSEENRVVFINTKKSEPEEPGPEDPKPEEPEPEKGRGHLFVRKTVRNNTGMELPNDKTPFTFTITLEGEDGTYAYSGENGAPSGTVSIINGRGVLRLDLCHGQSITILNLPEHTEYTVTEAPASGYYVEGDDTLSGTIPDGDSAAAIFINRRSGGGGGGGSSKDPGPDPDPTPTTQSETVTESETTTGVENTTESETSTEIWPGEDLPDPNDPGSPERVTILENGVPTTYVKVWDPNEEEFMYILENELPLGNMMLPKTGDVSQALLCAVLCGVSICATAALMLFRRKKKYKS